MRSTTDMSEALRNRRGSSRFFGPLRILEPGDDEAAHPRRGRTKLEARNRGIDGGFYGDSRRLLSG